MKSLLKLSSIAVLALVATVAQAATINLSPVTVAVTEGNSITLAVSVDPGSDKLYTVKAALSYPADMLEATSFTFSNGLLSLSQPGYDSMGNGMVIKTAGVSGGFTAARPFGTVTFLAKKSGTAIIAVQSTSLALNNQSKNTLAGTQGSTVVTVAARTVTPAPTPTPTPTPTPASKPAAKPATAGSAANTQTASTTATTTAAVSTSTNIAATAGAGTNFSPWLVGGLAAILVAGIGSWFIYRRRTGI